jgi:hypothetical protein
VTRTAATLGLTAGVAAILLAALTGAAGDLVLALATPPPVVRAFLVGIAIVTALWLLGRSLRRIDDAGAIAAGGSGTTSTAELGAMLRGIRLVFLAAAALAVAIGWLVGHPLPIVIGLVIAGVDLAETSFLLLVAAGRRHEERAEEARIEGPR